MTETTTGKTEVSYSEQGVVCVRELNAPVERVFAAYTTADQIKNWWGPARYETEVQKFDPQAGGEWHFVQRAEGEAAEHGFRGVYHDVVENQYIVQTFEYLGAPGHVSIEKMTFEDIGGRTRLVAEACFESPEMLAGMQQGGMESGMLETYDRLAALVEAS
jgi:uncharacterized protein YndB with AHSA1/START domain